MRWISILLVVIAMGCSADKANDGKQRKGDGTAGVDATATTDTAGEFGNPFGGSSGGDTAGVGGGVMNDQDAGCEVGKLCKPTDPDSDNCGTLTLKGDAKMVEKPGNVLIIFDRSGSMSTNWNGTPRWQAGGTALIDGLTPIADKLTIGAVLFPSPKPVKMCDPGDWQCMGGSFGQVCDVNPITAADQVNFKPGMDAITELQSGGTGGEPKYKPISDGSTPTSEAVTVADMSLAGATLMGTTCAVIITDGDPTCTWNQNMTVATIEGWLSKQNIKTYVIGLPGASGGDGATRLNALAAAGGTTKYIEPTDTAELQKRLKEIVSQTVSVGFESCTIHLDPVADVPEKLQLVVVDKGVKQSVPHMFPGEKKEAWTISKDGGTVEMMGQLCSDVKSGRFSAIEFTFGCMDLPVLPPTPEPE